MVSTVALVSWCEADFVHPQLGIGTTVKAGGCLGSPCFSGFQMPNTSPTLRGVGLDHLLFKGTGSLSGSMLIGGREYLMLLHGYVSPP